MNTYLIDNYDHNGMHLQIEKVCLCNEYDETISIDYDKNLLFCDLCGDTKQLPKNWKYMTEQDIINYWLLK